MLRESIANSPNSAQLGGIPYHCPSYVLVRAIVWAYGRGQTHRQTDTQTRVTTIHFASSTTRAKCNYQHILYQLLSPILAIWVYKSIECTPLIRTDL